MDFIIRGSLKIYENVCIYIYFNEAPRFSVGKHIPKYSKCIHLHIFSGCGSPIDEKYSCSDEIFSFCPDGKSFDSSPNSSIPKDLYTDENMIFFLFDLLFE